MKAKLLVLFFSIIFSNTFGQARSQLDINNILADVYSNGTLFDGVFEVPAGSFKNTIYLSSFWIGGKDSVGQLHIASQVYGQAGNDVFYGPIAANYSDPTYIQHDAVYKVNQTVINDHIAYYQNVGYVVPNEISRWPGNGNTSNGEATSLAPYVDVNQNGTYDPANGDYPMIRGDQAVYFICNDSRSNHTESGGAPLGVEFHGMLYGYNSSDPALHETVFLNLEIYNRSSLNYDSVYFGLFVDMDLGNYNDDYVGYDSVKHVFYTYNANTIDAVYGNVVPAQGCLSLNRIPSKFVYYSNDASVQGNPVNATEYYQYLKGQWRDGSPMTYGGIGYGGSTPTNFMFSGYPESGIGWTENGVPTFPDDRRGLLSFGPFSFESQEQICYDFAFPFANGTGNPLNSLQNVRTRCTTLQAIYDSCSCDCSFHTGVPQISNEVVLKFYPNPSTGKFEVSTQMLALRMEDKIQVYSSFGALVYESSNIQDHVVIDLNNYADGIYIAKITTKDKIFSSKLIKQ